MYSHSATITQCEGDCDKDSDCKSKLQCFQRNENGWRYARDNKVRSEVLHVTNMIAGDNSVSADCFAYMYSHFFLLHSCAFALCRVCIPIHGRKFQDARDMGRMDETTALIPRKIVLLISASKCLCSFVLPVHL